MVESGVGFGYLVTVAEGHKARDREGEDEFGGGGRYGAAEGLAGDVGDGDVGGGRGAAGMAGVDAAQAAFLGDDEVDGAADAFVVDADGYDVVAVVGYGGGDGAALEAEVADEGFCHGGGEVAVDDDYF